MKKINFEQIKDEFRGVDWITTTMDEYTAAAFDYLLERLEKYEQVRKLSDGVVGWEQGEITDWDEIFPEEAK